jgi:osmotically-inducible protein OsmY
MTTTEHGIETEHSTDHQLKDAIERELDWTADVNGDRVGISVNDGAVTLSGEVESYPERTSAVTAALRVRGVRSLVDQIVVHHRFGHRQDADIAREAAMALNQTVVVPAESVSATVRDHEITLTGSVAWDYQRVASSHAVEAIHGVTAVRNAITLKPPVAMIASEDAKANITAAFLRNAQLEAQHIDVSVKGTQIRLSGHVATWAERHQAEVAAWCTPGVTHVDDRITVVS